MMDYQVLWKAHIKTHWRTLKGGRKVEVKAHERKSRPRLFSELKPTRKRKFNIPGQLELPLMVMDPEEFRKELKKRRIERAEKKRKQWGELLFKEDPNLASEREFLQRKAKAKLERKGAKSHEKTYPLLEWTKKLKSKEQEILGIKPIPENLPLSEKIELEIENLANNPLISESDREEIKRESKEIADTILTKPMGDRFPEVYEITDYIPYPTIFRRFKADTVEKIYEIRKKYGITLPDENVNLLKRFGGSIWSKIPESPKRVYFNKSRLADLYGLDVSYYKTGAVSTAKLDGQVISNSRANKILSRLSGKFWYDSEDGEFHWKDIDNDDAKILMEPIRKFVPLLPHVAPHVAPHVETETEQQNLPELIGSEKQISYGNEIRSRTLNPKALDEMIEMSKLVKPWAEDEISKLDERQQRTRQGWIAEKRQHADWIEHYVPKIIESLKNENTAKFWVDNRFKNLIELIHRQMPEDVRIEVDTRELDNFLTKKKWS